MDEFVTSSFKSEIYENVVLENFPKLNSTDKQILLDYIVNIINIMACTFVFDANDNGSQNWRSNYEYQFKQNDYRDATALMLLLLPYINDTSKKSLTSFDDLYTKKNSKYDINITEPIYEYSNIQYNRCIRKLGDITERPFRKDYLDHNYLLLLNTIRSTSNKLYINWYDVIPYSLFTFKSSKLYSDTYEKFTGFNGRILEEWDIVSQPTFNSDIKEKLAGLSIDDIYDSISNEFYQNIKDIKWIIYDIDIPEINYHIPMIIGCRHLFEDLDLIGSMTKNIQWTRLTDNERTYFKEQWKMIVNNVFEGRGMVTSVQFSNIILTRIVRSLIVALHLYYKYRYQAISRKEFKPNKRLLKEMDDSIDVDEESPEIQKINITDLKESLETLDPKHMYEFIRMSLQKFKYTWYSRYLIYSGTGSSKDSTIDRNGTIITYNDFPVLDKSSLAIDGCTVTLTLKNVYNYAKSIVHFFDSSKKEKKRKKTYLNALPKFWKSLNSEQKTETLLKLNNKKEDLEWFNIKGNIKMTYGSRCHHNVDRINEEIHEMVRKNLIKYIFESMIMRGVLSKFVPNKEISDEKIMPNDEESAAKVGEILKKTIFKIAVDSKSGQDNIDNIYQGSYYYLTGTRYADIPKVNYVDRKTKISSKIHYFEYNTKNPWYTLYAHSWISQINFFHRYLNNRIIFATGSTGVGKSTQVPKLFMYALKAIDYKNFGSVVCTQPRKTPTEKGALTVSSELGVPIDNGELAHVQFKHKSDSYVRDVDGLVLKFVTDGSLIQELTNPVFKDTLKDSKHYSNKNIYDIVIIDEAHEHNKNMDLILTLMRHMAYYNNEIKLVIISATMDADEHRYRRYYRDVNDNRILPFNMKLVSDKLDRINVDRRFHISPPGRTTKFTITEHYVPNADPIDLIVGIVSSDPIGHILFFQPGTAEIDDNISKLNKRLPANVIALPLHSKIPTFLRKILENIDTKIGEIKFSKDTKIFDEKANNGVTSYDRVVIVSTNIAEASVTIPGLTYVVDTGTQKILRYDPKRNVSSILLRPISESSRLQRRGRVGRVGNGTVYYLYEEGFTEKTVPVFDIVISNIFMELYAQLRDSYHEQPIFTSLNDPNLVNVSGADGVANVGDVGNVGDEGDVSDVGISNITISKLNKLYDINKIKGLAKVIERHYFINGKFFDYYGNDAHYDYSNIKPLNSIYPTGFSIETLTDRKGHFFIIHPEEVFLKRNIVGDITGLQTDESEWNLTFNSYDQTIKSNKMELFWKTCIDNLLISTYSDNEDTDNKNEKQKCLKTAVGKQILLLQQEAGVLETENLDIGIIYMLLYGMAVGVGDEMIKIITVILETTNDFKKAFIDKVKIDSLKKIIGLKKTDVEAILSVTEEIHRMLHHNGISLNLSSERYVGQLHSIKKDIMETMDMTKMGQVKEGDVHNIVGKLLKEGKINNSNEFEKNEYNEMRKEECVNVLVLKKIKEREENTDFIKKWASRRYLKTDFVFKYIRKYLKFKNLIYLIENGLTKKKELKLADTVTKIRSSIHMVDELEIGDALNNKITFAMMNGFKYQIAKKVIDTFYLNIHEPAIENIYKIDTDMTFVDSSYLQSYVLYLSVNVERETISQLSYVNYKLLRYLSYVYSQDYVFNKYAWYQTQKINIPGKLISNEVVGIYKKVLKEISDELLEVHDVGIWSNLLILFEDPKYIEIRRSHDLNYSNSRQFQIQNGGLFSGYINLNLIEFLLYKLNLL